MTQISQMVTHFGNNCLSVCPEKTKHSKYAAAELRVTKRQISDHLKTKPPPNAKRHINVIFEIKKKERKKNISLRIIECQDK